MAYRNTMDVTQAGVSVTVTMVKKPVQSFSSKDRKDNFQREEETTTYSVGITLRTLHMHTTTKQTDKNRRKKNKKREKKEKRKVVK